MDFVLIMVVILAVVFYVLRKLDKTNGVYTYTTATDEDGNTIDAVKTKE